MDTNLENARDEICQELSSKWLVLSNQVRQQALSLKSRTVGTALSGEASALAQDSEKLCGHFERLHGDLEKLLKLLSDEETELGQVQSAPVATESARQAIQAQDKDHRKSDDLKDVIKALFMWRDNPVRNRQTED
jgi:hypothetical protein